MEASNMAKDRQNIQDRDSPQQDDEQARRERIAVAAYHNAERRGFGPNGELDDWLQAERQVDSLAGKGGPREEAAAQQPDRLRAAAGEPGAGLPPADSQKARRADGIERPDFPDLHDAGVPHIKPDEVTHWAKKLDVPAPRLREAIRRVGPVVEDVKRFLRG
jgi:hypothetical protein